MIRTLNNDIRAMEEAFDRLFGGVNRPVERTTVIPIDVTERENAMVIRAALPGVDRNDLDVAVEKEILTIRAQSSHTQVNENEKVYRREVAFGSFTRSIRLPEGLNHDAIDAELKNGVLTLVIPKMIEEKAKPKKIEIRTDAVVMEPALPVEGSTN